MGTTLYRPPQWQSGLQPVMITTPGSSSYSAQPQYSSSNGVPTYVVSKTQSVSYVFDAVIRLQHEQRWRATQHPVQTGANIADHVIVQPARLTLEIGMSDAMDAYSDGMWAGSSSKSVSAYQTLLSLGNARLALTITTRLRTYANMVLVGAPSEETAKTFGALRCILEFEQLFVADAATTAASANSARPQTTASTQLGSVNPAAPSVTDANQYNTSSLSAAPGTFAALTNVLGAGSWSSVNTQNLQQVAS